MNMTCKELVSSIRELADRLERSELADTAGSFNLNLWVHGVRKRNLLRAWVAMMNNPKPVSADNNHWFKEDGEPYSISVFYEPAACGFETVMVPTIIGEVDVESLIGESDEPPRRDPENCNGSCQLDPACNE